MSEIPVEVEAALASIQVAAGELRTSVEVFIATVTKVVLDQVEAKLDADDVPVAPSDEPTASP